MTTHAKLSPSAAKRWLTCPGSINLVDILELKDSTSKYAAEGTVAHEIGERCLKSNVHPNHFLNDKIKADGFTFKVSENMVEAVEEYVDYIKEKRTSGVEMLIEVRCSLKSLGIPGMDGGTSDCVLIDRATKEIHIIDYKHGQGVAVEVHDNPQALSYALGVLISLDIEIGDIWNVHNTIVQPRAFHPDGPIRTEITTSDSVWTWGIDVLVPGAKATLERDAKLSPSEDACRFCLASGQCPALYNRTQEMAISDFKEDKFPEPIAMTTEQKTIVMEHAAMIKSFITAVENQIKVEVDAGSTEYSGHFKLVRKTTRRKFIDEALDEVCSPLLDHMHTDDVFVQKPRTLSEIEKRLKKAIGKKNADEIMADITTKPEGATVIAPLSDKRRAIQPSIVSDFENLD